MQIGLSRNDLIVAVISRKLCIPGKNKLARSNYMSCWKRNFVEKEFDANEMLFTLFWEVAAVCSRRIDRSFSCIKLRWFWKKKYKFKECFIMNVADET